MDQGPSGEAVKLSEAYAMASLERLGGAWFKTTVQVLKELLQLGTDAQILRALPLLGMPSINYSAFLPRQLNEDLGIAGVAAMWECLDWLYIKGGWSQAKITRWLEGVEEYIGQTRPGMLERMRHEVPDGFADRPKWMARVG